MPKKNKNKTKKKNKYSSDSLLDSIFGYAGAIFIFVNNLENVLITVLKKQFLICIPLLQ